jgi:hypothetical protein
MNQPLANLDFYCEVESDAFASRVSVASTLAVFKHAIRQDGAYSRLLHLLSTTKAAPAAVAKRVALLSSQTIDPSYSNPFDAALTAYVMALQETSSVWLRFAATLALHAPQTWWSRAVCLDLLKSVFIAKEAERSQYVVGSPGPGAALATIFSGDARYQQSWVVLGDVLSSPLSANHTIPISLFSTSFLGQVDGEPNPIVSSQSTMQEKDFEIASGP